MTYQDMLNAILLQSEQERRRLIRDHWRDAFSDGFIAYVQSQIDAAEAFVNGEKRGLAAWLPDIMQDVAVAGNKLYLGQLVTVWNSMKVVYAQLAAASKAEGSPTGIAATAKSNGTMPRGTTISMATTCSRCGAASDGGLCTGCLDHEDFVEADRVEFQRLEYEQQEYQTQLNDQEYFQQQAEIYQADTSYYDTQPDFNENY